MSAVMGRLDSGLIQPEFSTMQFGDLDAVMAIERRIYEFPWTRGNFEDSLTSGYGAWLMREGASLIGYAVMMLVLDEAHLLNISIIPERQRSGMGSAMLNHLLDYAVEHGVVRMLLEVRPSNVSGLAFYKHHGFVQVGERPGYYPARHGRETAWVLGRIL
ncbi:MAG: ribosomal protein S18-alanine N-acetyltransferase [Sterolibacterium sp.]